MHVAWLWIKGLAALSVVVGLTVMGLLLNVSQAETAALLIQLEQAKQVNQTHTALIQTLTQERLDMNQLLVSRQAKQNQLEEQRHDDMEAIRVQLAGIQCYQQPWPDDVTQRLREPY
ncbi:hypothetical protein L4D77_15210 [Photobacterium frigidiphilum]|uniref:hypothetical protein n=1 Tax=Photobacterium frigidiphilum TaxID=264736 RepID=UPI003D14CA87